MPIKKVASLASATLAVIFHAAPALAQPAPIPDQVAVEGAWSRATPPGAQTGAVYLTLTSPAGDRLVGASSPSSRKAEVHEMRMEGPVMRMREATDGLDLPAGQHVALAPGGYHLMLVDLAAPLKQGQTVHVRLTFQKSPPAEVDVPIGAVGAAAPPGTVQPMPDMKRP